MNSSRLAPEAARIALLDRLNYSRSALQTAYDSHKILLEQLNEISDEPTMPDKILLEVEEYLEPEYTRAARIENIKLWLTVVLGVSSLCLTLSRIAVIYYIGVVLFGVALILGIVLLVLNTALRKGNIQQRRACLYKFLSIIGVVLFFAICLASFMLYEFNEDPYFIFCGLISVGICICMMVFIRRLHNQILLLRIRGNIFKKALNYKSNKD